MTQNSTEKIDEMADAHLDKMNKKYNDIEKANMPNILMHESFKAGHAAGKVEAAEEIGITCPFCKENDFDLIGLKYHFQRGYCATFEKLNTEERSR